MFALVSDRLVCCHFSFRVLSLLLLTSLEARNSRLTFSNSRFNMTVSPFPSRDIVTLAPPFGCVAKLSC